jgi:hypothetical protein
MTSVALRVAQEINRILKENPAALGDDRKLKSVLKDIRKLDGEFDEKGGLFFHTGSDAFETAKRFTQIHIEQYRQTGRPSLPALAVHHAEKLGLDKNSAVYKALIMVAVRAEMKAAVSPPYHSKYHYTDVAAVTANLLEKNNEMLKAGDSRGVPLTVEEQALTFIAAIGHDLDHEGRDNPKDDVYFNEKKSFCLMEPLLREAGVSPVNTNKVYTILLTTSPNGPHAVLKGIAHAQREGKAPDFAKIDPENKFAELRVLAKDVKLTQMAAIVSDSDLYASSGAGLKSSETMAGLLTVEKNKAGDNSDLTTDGSRKYFFDNIVGKEGYASNAGRAANNASFEALRAENDRRLAAAAPKPPQ